MQNNSRFAALKQYLLLNIPTCFTVVNFHGIYFDENLFSTLFVVSIKRLNGLTD